MVWAITYNGTCGDHLKWVLDTETGLLVISGTGAMTNFAAGSQPWYQYRTHITGCRIEAGCTSVAPNAFYNCTKLASVSYPLSLDNTFPEFECSQKEPPVVITKDATNVTSTTATINGKVTSGSDATYGFCWGTNLAALTNCDNRGVGTGDFHWDITGLTPNTTYYFGAFASNEVGSDNGDFLSFTTPKVESEGTDECGHAWVQLWAGGPKWATVNLGASTDKDPGNYYMYGNASAVNSDYCDWSGYSPYKGSNKNTAPYTKYGTAGDGLTTLQSTDDAATQAWGCGWRTPTKNEMDSLVKMCNVTYSCSFSPISSYYKFTSKENGKSIILPTAGYRYQSSIFRVGTYARYMTSTSIPNASTKENDCYMLYWYSKSTTNPQEDYTPHTTSTLRSWGISIRAVRD